MICVCTQGVRPPDMRRNVSEYQTIFPTIDFSQAYIFFHFSFIYKSYSWKAILHIKLSQYIINVTHDDFSTLTHMFWMIL